MRYVALQMVTIAALLAAVFSRIGPPLLHARTPLAAPSPPAVMPTAPPAFPQAGALLWGAALALALWGLASLGRSLAIAPTPRPGGRFVARGPYRWMRHPMYTSLLLLGAGSILRCPTWPVLGAALALTGVLSFKVRLEEALLSARYPEYADYRARTWGLFPLPWPRPARSGPAAPSAPSAPSAPARDGGG